MDNIALMNEALREMQIYEGNERLGLQEQMHLLVLCLRAVANGLAAQIQLQERIALALEQLVMHKGG